MSVPLICSMVCVDLEHSHLHRVCMQTHTQICIIQTLRHWIVTALEEMIMNVKHGLHGIEFYQNLSSRATNQLHKALLMVNV